MDLKIEELDQYDKDEVPSPFGQVEFVVMGSPVSVQARKSLKDEYISNIRQHFENTQYVLMGLLNLEIIWHIPAKSRFETDRKADIDNCIKPMIDALTGIEGLFVDDCQLSSLHIAWRSIESEGERVSFKLEFVPDDYLPKENLIFIEIDKKLCIPADSSWGIEVKRIWQKHIEQAQKTKSSLEQLDFSYLAAASILSGGTHLFHKSRVNGFPLVSFEEFFREVI